MSIIPPPRSDPTRRAFLKVGAAAPVALAGLTRPATAASNGDGFTYQVIRTEDEWRELLTDDEFFVMRRGGTEVPHTSVNAFETRDGVYACKGCDLVSFTSQWKIPLFEIGWAFYAQANPDTILTAIDGQFEGMGGEKVSAIECHCRRCGSHFGHILNVRGDVLHCLNGSAFNFLPA